MCAGFCLFLGGLAPDDCDVDVDREEEDDDDDDDDDDDGGFVSWGRSRHEHAKY